MRLGWLKCAADLDPLQGQEEWDGERDPPRRYLPVSSPVSIIFVSFYEYVAVAAFL